jgi:beta-glucanase (GH16 family)
MGLAVSLQVSVVTAMASAALAGLMPAGACAKTLRLSTAQHTVRDALGKPWQPDRYAFGGRLERRPQDVGSTTSPQLYRTRRVGVRSYSVPVNRPATYAVTLYLAEDRGALAGTRVFDVLAEGVAVATNVDTAATSAVGAPDHVVFTIPVTDGRLTLRFVAHRGEPQVSAIKITVMRRSTAPAAVRWHDEFDGPAGHSPNPARWAFDRGIGSSPGWGNDELETYTDRPENAALDGTGSLAITARREGFRDRDGAIRSYTSARIKTQKRYWFTYGEAAARIRVPAGTGIWPAFWAVGENVYHVGWPASGELDVFEVLSSDPMSIWGSIHGPARKGGAYGRGRRMQLAQSAALDFHVYSVLWVPGAIQMRFDGRRYATYTPEDLGPRRRWVYDHPFHLLLNVAVGGKGSNPPQASTPFPATMLVDWVRVSK